MSKLCRGNLPSSDCFYYVSWDAYVVLGDDWINIYGGGYSVAGGTWRRLGEALIYPPSLEAQGYKSVTYDYFKYYDSVKLNPQSGGGYTLYGLGGMWGDPEGKKQAEPDEFPFFYIWSPEEGKVTTADIRFQLGGPPENWSGNNRDYYTNFGTRCGGLPNFTTGSCERPKYLGGAAPPPLPPKKNMDCCDCNTIATIIADQMANQFRLFESIKDHIDLRTKEEIQIYREQLEALEIDLQPIIDRLNEVERSLWNGIPK